MTSGKGARSLRSSLARLTRLDAFVIKAADGMSYDEILRKMEEDSNFKELGSIVNETCRTGAKDLLFELQRTVRVKATEF